jgi:hypothetical protein
MRTTWSEVEPKVVMPAFLPFKSAGCLMSGRAISRNGDTVPVEPMMTTSLPATFAVSAAMAPA